MEAWNIKTAKENEIWFCQKKVITHLHYWKKLIFFLDFALKFSVINDFLRHTHLPSELQHLNLYSFAVSSEQSSIQLRTIHSERCTSVGKFKDLLISKGCPAEMKIKLFLKFNRSREWTSALKEAGANFSRDSVQLNLRSGFGGRGSVGGRQGEG